MLGKEVKLTLSSDRAEVPPWGLNGGGPGRVSRCRLIGPDGAEQLLPSKVTTFVSGDCMIVSETPGGGGWGSPKRRDPQAVRWDVMEGLVSVVRARDVYGVVVDPETMEVNEAKTRALRKREGVDDGEDG